MPVIRVFLMLRLPTLKNRDNKSYTRLCLLGFCSRPSCLCEVRAEKSSQQAGTKLESEQDTPTYLSLQNFKKRAKQFCQQVVQQRLAEDYQLTTGAAVRGKNVHGRACIVRKHLVESIYAEKTPIITCSKRPVALRSAITAWSWTTTHLEIFTSRMEES